MPWAPGRPCNWPGCAAIVHARYCPAHARMASQRRGTTTARGLGGEHQRLRKLVLERDGYTCWRCGGYATTADHVVPRADGGPASLANLRAACAACNSGRRR